MSSGVFANASRGIGTNVQEDDDAVAALECVGGRSPGVGGFCREWLACAQRVSEQHLANLAQLLGPADVTADSW